MELFQTGWKNSGQVLFKYGTVLQKASTKQLVHRRECVNRDEQSKNEHGQPVKWDEHGI
jgi:hypothetical protein